MSLMQSVSRFKRVKGEGYSRKAFYSPTYDVIVKVERERKGKYSDSFTHQSEGEIELFNMLTEEEKQYFAIIGYFYKDGIPYIISEPCLVPEKMTKSQREEFYSELYDGDNSGINNVIDKYQIRDLGGGDNYGLTRDGRIVITDCGLWGSY